MQDAITSGIKTSVQALVAFLVAWLTSLGIDLGDTAVQLESAIVIILTGLSAVGLNWAGTRWPIVNRIISLGRSTSSAAY